jgi:hypothetical protein
MSRLKYAKNNTTKFRPYNNDAKLGKAFIGYVKNNIYYS